MQGAPGLQGPVGIVGEGGQKGYEGVVGPKGSYGRPGLMGSKGIKGERVSNLIVKYYLVIFGSSLSGWFSK